MRNFVQLLRQAQILILKIQPVFLRLKFSPFLNLNKISHFLTDIITFRSIIHRNGGSDGCAAFFV